MDARQIDTSQLIPGVTVSSTYRDLKEHRAALIDVINKYDLHPIAMENDHAKDEDLIQSSLEFVQKGAAYTCIIGKSYGQIPVSQQKNPNNLSITELEFNEALRLKKKILLFIMAKEHLVVESEVFEEKQKKLAAFKERAGNISEESLLKRVHSEFSSLDDFKTKVHPAIAYLREYLKENVERLSDSEGNPPIPKSPKFYAEPHYIVSNKFVGRKLQLQELSKWSLASEPHTILLFQAIGGNGKSMLTWEWINKYALNARNDWAGRFWYSFYEKGAVMTDFCQRALAYMSGHPLKTFEGLKTPELTKQLLYYLHQRPWLFVLDGLERVLVAYHRIDAAEVSDEEVNIPTDKIVHRDPLSCIRPEDDELLSALANAGPSKLLISSRLLPKALTNKGNTPLPTVLPIELPGLDPMDAEELLKSYGITGNSINIQNYLKTHCDCHPLVIGVLAGLINDYFSDRGNFDAWTSDKSGGNQLNLANLDLIQKRNHILKAGLKALTEKSRQLLSTLALLSESADYPLLSALNPFLPPLPKKVNEPVKPEDSWRFSYLLDSEKKEYYEQYEKDIERWEEYNQALIVYYDSPEYLEAIHMLEETVKDLVRRGLLQYDGRTKRYDLHPVVRGVTAGSLNRDENEKYGRRVVDYFSQQSHNPYEQTERIEDLHGGLEVVRALLKMGRYQQAYDAYHNELARALQFNFEASDIILSLLRPFFPNRWSDIPTCLKSKSDQSYLLTSVARALMRIGEISETLAVSETVLKLDLSNEKYKDWIFIQISLIEISEILTVQNRLAAAERCNLLATEIGEIKGDTELLFRERLDRLEHLAKCGHWEEANELFNLLKPNKISFWRAVNRSRLADLVFTRFHFWQGNLNETLLVEAEENAKANKNHTAIRLLHALRGRWQLERKNWKLAVESFHEAIRMARAVGILDLESEVYMAFSKFRLGILADPNSEAESFSQLGESAPHLALAEFWLALENNINAKEHALKAYKWAWAEGEPYVHRYELNKSIVLLSQLGIEIPELSRYNERTEKKGILDKNSW